LVAFSRLAVCPVKAKVVLVGSGAKVSMIALDLDDPDEALAVAEQVAQQTGRTVTIRDAKGEIIAKIRAPIKN
jgi:hypothetical protein